MVTCLCRGQHLSPVKAQLRVPQPRSLMPAQLGHLQTFCLAVLTRCGPYLHEHSCEFVMVAGSSWYLHVKVQ